ncbi:hypothetical protein HYV70_00185 [Candidatus Uhrbacteria bacterium]|nr:hypothetical protein [Candidatus Uhrbacteria bacterium]
MRVLEVGRAHPDWKRKFDCENCGTIVEVERSNLVFTYTHDISGPRNRVVADCIVCKYEIVIDDPAHDDWGDLPHKSYCRTCQQRVIVAATDLADPHCSNCGASVTVHKAQKKKQYR